MFKNRLWMLDIGTAFGGSVMQTHQHTIIIAKDTFGQNMVVLKKQFTQKTVKDKLSDSYTAHFYSEH